MLLRLQALWRLGIINVARVALYRMALRFRVHPVVLIRSSIEGQEFYKQPEQLIGPHVEVPCSWCDKGLFFGWHKVPLNGSPPAWHANVFTGKVVDTPLLPWWKISDFGLNVGDIKTVWEPSRFDWVLAFAMRAKKGDTASIEQLNSWLSNWCVENPSYYGSNWKCGQEASIRVLHLAMAVKLLGQTKVCPDLLRLIKAHLLRISPTLSYSIAQDNNHGTSEAAALYIGGLLCEKQGVVQGRRWANKGRRLLENRIKHLIASDGSFSQYSTNYHRVLLDTLSMVEIWRRWQADNRFSTVFYQRIQAATNWLYSMVDPCQGDAPNLGGNDGARLLPLTDTAYRDYRTSVQMAMVLFRNRLAYDPKGTYTLPLIWNDIPLPVKYAGKATSQQFDDGGYGVLRNESMMAVFKYPRYQFRPRHCDALHLDFWLGSENLLRDGGSYRYNVAKQWRDYFTGASGHNTIEFDGREQMPSLGRFLRGAWLSATDVKFNNNQDSFVSASAGYCDWKGACHHRSVQLHSCGVLIRDTVENFNNCAVLRWRLRPGDWLIEGETVIGELCSLQIVANVPIVRFELIEGWESREYYKKTPLPVLEVEICKSGEITTTLCLQKNKFSSKINGFENETCHNN